MLLPCWFPVSVVKFITTFQAARKSSTTIHALLQLAVRNTLFDSFSVTIPGTLKVVFCCKLMHERFASLFSCGQKVLTTFMLGRTIIRPNNNIFTFGEALLFPYFQFDVQHMIQKMCVKDVFIFFPEDTLQPKQQNIAVSHM